MGETVKPAIICFTSAGEETAQTVVKLTGGRFYRCGSGHADARDVLQTLFKADIPIIGICASGILVRLLAPHLNDKALEPPVIAVSANGHHVVPLLGGHRGANRMARDLADEIRGIAAITTASDARFAFALDEPPVGYVIADRSAAKPAMAAVLEGDELHVKGAGAWLAEAGYPVSEEGTVSVEITEREVEEGLLAYHPKTLVAGVGCARGTDAEEIVGLVRRTLDEAGLSEKSLAALATIDIKADEAGLNQAAHLLGVPLCLFTAQQLAAESYRLPNPSEVVLAEVGTPGVAEAAALKAGTLLVEKHKTANATCAIGRSTKPLDTEKFGRPRGELHLVGIGPGEPDQRTASAIAALQKTGDWVGYGLYLDLIGDLRTDQKEHRFGLGDEEPRVRHALELAASGKRVALVCSGDAQIYAMAALACELLEAEGVRAVSDAARRVVLESHPGISAFQMASARAGALIGHDFCCISLSDLLTPREDILKRLKAAAEGDFVTAFYNPRSQRRTELIEVTKDMFLQHRPPETPVIVASNLGRPEEKVEVMTLSEFDPEKIDMLTIVLIGSSQSRVFARGDGVSIAYTPRGYERKAAP